GRPVLVDLPGPEKEGVLASNGVQDAQSRRAQEVVLAVLRVLGVQEEERTIGLNRASPGDPALIAPEAVLDGVSREVPLEERRAGVDRRPRAPEVEDVSVEIVAARGRRDVDDAVARPSELGRVIRRQDRDLPREPDRHGELLAAEKVLVVVET